MADETELFCIPASKTVVFARLLGVRQRPPQGAEFVCVPCGANNSKSSAARRAGSSPATGTTTSEEASTVPFPSRGENCTMLASSTYDGYSVSFGEGYEFHGLITYTWVIPIKGRPTKGR